MNSVLDLSEKDRKEMIKLITENKICASIKDGLYLTGYLEYKKNKGLKRFTE